MYFDLNVPVPPLASVRKGKAKEDTFLPSQLEEIESRIDLLVHLGYTVIGLSQTVHKRRDGILYLKRLNIILDEDSEKGFGLINASIPLFDTYDIIALIPTTHATFSLACLTHSQPSPLTAHVIALPLTLPRLAFHMKHTLVRTAIKNGSVFEINYVGALGGNHDSVSTDAGVMESGASAKRNWWAASRELVRVTKGKGLLLSGGVASSGDLRAPRDIGNLITMLGLPQDAAHAMATTNAKSLVLRAQTRKTYRAVFSEPRLITPQVHETEPEIATGKASMKANSEQPSTQITGESENAATVGSKKRIREDCSVASPDNKTNQMESNSGPSEKQTGLKKKKRKKNQD
ncbi:hypothetical protein NP233_g1370 [Leucocoprinus birnbaumii]|uniref:Uncharacterized protein n=1 Tax=Leucocoprinus birnbaumii TaxID=56174 RepID=A0AAD5W374_9AGAR|nr:hypothetical protein NP233_g1370 [Leucocoprinus birnbaumii]